MGLGDSLERVLSRPVAKPYRSSGIKDGQIHLNADGHLDFAPGDVENPKNWSTPRRWYVTVVCICLVLNATFASSSPTGCLPSISATFGISEEAAGLVTTLFLLGYCAGPLFWAPMSEFYGRRWIFYGTFSGYLAFNFLCAFTRTFAGLLIGRFLTGTLASACLSNVPGVLADLWQTIERGNAMAVFSMITFAGPALGPVISGFLQVDKDWRWSFYVLLWLAAFSMIFMFTVPETLPSQVLINKAKRIRRAKIPGYEDVRAPAEASERTLTGIFKVALVRPWIILFDPIALLVAIYLSVCYTLLYALFTIYPIVFQEKRGWNAGVGELPLIGLMIGAILGSAIVFFESTLGKKQMLAGKERTPEDRLPLAALGGVLFPITMFWFAWTGEYNSVPWIVPTIAGTFLSTAILLIFVSYLNYLTDSYLMYAASAIAGNTIARSACGASAPLFTNYMFNALGVGGGGSLIGGVAVLLAPIPFLFYRYGGPIRKRSRFAPTEGGSGPAQQKEDTNETDNAARAGSGRRSSSIDDALALDEEAGVPTSADMAEKASGSEKSTTDGDRFLDADGMEKAER